MGQGQRNAVPRKIIADNLKQAGWSLGWVSALDAAGATLS